MVERLTDLPDNVVGISATGKVTAQDYESTIIPAVEDVLKRHDRVRFLYHLGAAFDGFEAAAMWDDAKLGLAHFAAWERVAMVTDVDWLRVAMKVMGVVMPGHMRVFYDSELDEAKRWVAE